jgi:ABC-type antimicrobial peptide transport system permease subunit
MIKKSNLKIIFFIIFLVLIKNNAYAYIGPGMTGGAIAATIGIIVAIFAALFGLIWFPVKRLLKKKKVSSFKNDNLDNEKK